MRTWGAIRQVRLQLALFGILGALHVLSARGVIPNPNTLATTLRDFFQHRGLLAVGAVSLAENIVGVNIYFPGSVVILLAMSMTAGNLKLAFLTYLWIVVPSALAHMINYNLGRFGRGNVTKIPDDLAGEPRPPHGEPSLLEFIIAFGHPHTAAVVSVRAGANRMPMNRFLRRFIPISLVWSTFWAILMYNVGDVLHGAAGNWIVLIYVYLILWTAWDLWQWHRRP